MCDVFWCLFYVAAHRICCAVRKVPVFGVFLEWLSNVARRTTISFPRDNPCLATSVRIAKRPPRLFRSLTTWELSECNKAGYRQSACRTKPRQLPLRAQSRKQRGRLVPALRRLMALHQERCVTCHLFFPVKIDLFNTAPSIIPNRAKTREAVSQRANGA